MTLEELRNLELGLRWMVIMLGVFLCAGIAFWGYWTIKDRRMERRKWNA